MNGADNRSRTYDLRITNALLYQLSYIGVVMSITEMNNGEKGRKKWVMRQCPLCLSGHFCITRWSVTHELYRRQNQSICR